MRRANRVPLIQFIRRLSTKSTYLNIESWHDGFYLLWNDKPLTQPLDPERFPRGYLINKTGEDAIQNLSKVTNKCSQSCSIHKCKIRDDGKLNDIETSESDETLKKINWQESPHGHYYYKIRREKDKAQYLSFRSLWLKLGDEVFWIRDRPGITSDSRLQESATTPGTPPSGGPPEIIITDPSGLDFDKDGRKLDVPGSFGGIEYERKLEAMELVKPLNIHGEPESYHEGIESLEQTEPRAVSSEYSESVDRYIS